jgi:hypothetical protein
MSRNSIAPNLLPIMLGVVAPLLATSFLLTYY